MDAICHQLGEGEGVAVCVSVDVSVRGFWIWQKERGVACLYNSFFLSIKAKAELVGLTKSVLDQKTEEKKIQTNSL